MSAKRRTAQRGSRATDFERKLRARCLRSRSSAQARSGFGTPSRSSCRRQRDCRQRWVVRMDKLGFAVSTGSACASGKEKPSHVLDGDGLCAPEEAGRVLRFSAGWRRPRRIGAEFLVAHLEGRPLTHSPSGKRRALASLVWAPKLSTMKTLRIPPRRSFLKTSSPPASRPSFCRRTSGGRTKNSASASSAWAR